MACSGLLASESVAGKHADAVEAYNAGDWARARALAEAVVGRDPAWPPYEFTLGLAAAATGDSQAAASAFRSAANADDLPESWLDLAAEELALGHTDAARTALAKAARLGLQRPAISMAIGDLATRLGQADLADVAFAGALRMLPSLAGDPWWHSDPARAARYPQLVADAIASADVETKWTIALAAGDVDAARKLVPRPSYPQGAFDPYAVIAAWAGDAAAFAKVLETCHLQATNSTAMDWCARLEARAGDESAANRYREISFLLLGEVAGPFEVRVSDGPVVGRNIAGGVAEFYGTYTYRRPTPWNPLVPSLVQLVLR
jgi:tetratricopeptide (TPR) repeat protein